MGLWISWKGNLKVIYWKVFSILVSMSVLHRVERFSLKGDYHWEWRWCAKSGQKCKIEQELMEQSGTLNMYKYLNIDLTSHTLSLKILATILCALCNVLTNYSAHSFLLPKVRSHNRMIKENQKFWSLLLSVFWILTKGINYYKHFNVLFENIKFIETTFYEESQ
jgi:hypothetical protein